MDPVRFRPRRDNANDIPRATQFVGAATFIVILGFVALARPTGYNAWMGLLLVTAGSFAVLFLGLMLGGGKALRVDDEGLFFIRQHRYRRVPWEDVVKVTRSYSTLPASGPHPKTTRCNVHIYTSRELFGSRDLWTYFNLISSVSRKRLTVDEGRWQREDLNGIYRIIKQRLKEMREKQERVEEMREKQERVEEMREEEMREEEMREEEMREEGVEADDTAQER